MATKPQNYQGKYGQPQQEESVLDSITVAEGGAQLQNLGEFKEFAQMAIRSGLAPKGVDTVDKAVIAMQMGAELGLKPLQALQNIAVINGRPTLWGDALKGIVEASPVCQGITEWIEGDGDGQTAHCMTQRTGRGQPTGYSFSVADAKKAGLWGKQGPWQQYPKRMLQMRARGFCLRDAYPDILKGIMTAEEAIDLESIEVSAREPIRPTRAIQPQAAASGDHPTPATEGNSPPLSDTPPAGGPSHDPAGELISPAQLKRLYAIGGSCGIAADDIKAWLKSRYGFGSSKDVTTDVYEEICRKLESGNLGEEPPEPGSDG